MGVEAMIAFGGNLGDVRANFASSCGHLAQINGLTLLDSSPLYRSPPEGPPGQPDYLNAVVALYADMTAKELLRHLQAIEAQHGRTRSRERRGPRTLDLDLIAYDDTLMQTAHLILPHPRMHERMFVLQPLCDIRPDWRHPALQRTARELMAALVAQGVPLLKERQAWQYVDDA